MSTNDGSDTDLVIQMSAAHATGAGAVASSIRAQRLPARRSRSTINLILGCTGSVAAVKLPLICDRLLSLAHACGDTGKVDFNIVLLVSQSARRFVSDTDLHRVFDTYNARPTIAGTASVTGDDDDGDGRRIIAIEAEDEWLTWTASAQTEVLHIELRKWAHLCVVAPLSANTLAKMAAGLCDSVLLEVLRAWEYTTDPEDDSGPQGELGEMTTITTRVMSRPSKPIVVCPAMNTHMYLHPLTAKHLSVVRDELGYQVWGPVSKKLACGDIGVGGMVEWSELVDRIVTLARGLLGEKPDTQGKEAGPAVDADSVRI